MAPQSGQSDSVGEGSGRGPRRARGRKIRLANPAGGDKGNGPGIPRASTARAAPLPKKSTSLPNLFRVGRSRTGLGVFAAAPIRRGEFITEYWGKRVSNKEADQLTTKYLFTLNSRWTIDGADRRNTARYINHSCRPNAEVRIAKGSIRIYAARNIRPDDEITYNYGSGYFEMFIKPKGCLCAHCEKKRSGLRRKPRKAEPRSRT